MNISTYESKINALEAGGGGYDLVIEVNNHSSVGHITAAEIVGGSFASAYTKALRGEFINVRIFAYADLGEDGIFYRTSGGATLPALTFYPRLCRLYPYLFNLHIQR